MQPGTSLCSSTVFTLRMHTAFFKTVHLAGDGEEEHLASLKKAEREEWRSKVKVDSLVMHTIAGGSDWPSQVCDGGSGCELVRASNLGWYWCPAWCCVPVAVS